MNPQKARRILGILILLVSLGILIWGLWPFGNQVQILPVPPSELQLPTPEGILPVLWWLI